jgi:hypothetical protein
MKTEKAKGFVARIDVEDGRWTMGSHQTPLENRDA